MNELARWLLNLPEQASTIAPEVDALHYFVIGVTMLGSFAVFFTALVFVVRSRRQSLPTRRIVAPLWLEVTFISSLLSLFLFIWVLGFRQYMQMHRPPDGALEVYVVGKQWMWKFAYPSGAGSVGVLYVPANRPVKLLLTSRDVIHSFYVPAFRIKQDVLPGRYTVAWFEATGEGTFPIRCAEYCGTGHSLMLGDVVVLSPERFDEWLAQPSSLVAEARPQPGEPGLGARPTFASTELRETLASRGERVLADKGCLSCHTLDGTPHIGPTFAGVFGRTETMSDGSSIVVDEAYFTQSMMDPLAHVVAGYVPVMPSYQGRIDPAETAAIIEFVRTIPAAGLPGAIAPVHDVPPPGGER